jgi:hypothetical protein
MLALVEVGGTHRVQRDAAGGHATSAVAGTIGWPVLVVEE